MEGRGSCNPRPRLKSLMPNADASLQKTKPQQVVSCHSDCPLPLAWLTAPRLGSSVSCRPTLVGEGSLQGPRSDLALLSQAPVPTCYSSQQVLAGQLPACSPRKPLGPLKFILHTRARRLQDTHVHSSVIPCSQKVETTHMSIDGCLDT